VLRSVVLLEICFPSEVSATGFALMLILVVVIEVIAFFFFFFFFFLFFFVVVVVIVVHCFLVLILGLLAAE
jgi:hypothetical protein